MGRPLRTALGGLVYHVLTRANGRQVLFNDAGDYAAFERVLHEAQQRIAMRLLAYCVMPTHWHLVLWTYGDGDLSRFISWLTLTHTQRWHAYRQTVGTGHLYQGRFKSFVVQTDEYLLTVCRYVERNALRAKLVDRAEVWRWGSLWRREYGDAQQKTLISEWPIMRPKEWVAWVNEEESAEALKRIRQSIRCQEPSCNGE